MKKYFLIINLTIATIMCSGIVNSSIIPVSVKNKILHINQQPKLRGENDPEYANFSGHWVGTCDDTPEDITIELSEDLSTIYWDNQELPIDAISTTSSKGNINANETITHLRWSSDGHQLLGTIIEYSKDSNFSQGNLNSFIGKYKFYLENKQLHTDYNLSAFTDGDLDESYQMTCVFSKD